jgi:uncharacterized protein (UPF0264 family)
MPGIAYPHETVRIRLLASVTTLAEAADAVDGGADILDLKDPREGSLGAPSPRLISEVSTRFGELLPISVAIGDFPHLPHSAALAAVGAAQMGADYVKIGLRGSQTAEECLQLLNTVRESLEWQGRGTRLIAAAYADFRQAGTLQPSALPVIASRARLSGCMIDTLDKRKGTIFDCMTKAELRGFLESCRQQQLLSAIAGSISAKDLESLCELGPDIVGVRGAICQGGVRTATICRVKLEKFKSMLSRVAPETIYTEGLS